MRVAFKGEDVRTNPVKEETVVRDDHGTAREIDQRVFERAQGFNVQIVGRFIEQQHVAAFFQQTRHVHTVAFTTRQQADFLLLVTALEVEGTAIGAGVHFGIAKLDDLGPARNGLPDVVIRVQVIARLVNIGQINGIPQLDRAGIGLFMAGDHLEQGRFTRAVGADHADDPARRQREVQLFDQQLVAHGFGQTLDLKHLVAQTGTVGDNDLGARQALALRAVGHFVIGLDPRFGFRLTGLGPLTHPFQFARQCLLL